MARVNYRVCDRCGEKLGEFSFWTLKPTFKIQMIFNGLFDFCSTKYNYEFCRECGNEIQKYITTPAEKHGMKKERDRTQ
jgi:hypothetical protein